MRKTASPRFISRKKKRQCSTPIAGDFEGAGLKPSNWKEFSKEYWFKKLYLGFKITDRSHTHELYMDKSNALHQASSPKIYSQHGTPCSSQCLSPQLRKRTDKIIFKCRFDSFFSQGMKLLFGLFIPSMSWAELLVSLMFCTTWNRVFCPVKHRLQAG